MPHVIVKMNAGRSEAQKAALTDEIVKAVMTHAKCAEDAISVAIEDIGPGEWTEKVYRPDILPNLDQLHKKPGYDPL